MAIRSRLKKNGNGRKKPERLKRQRSIKIVNPNGQQTGLVSYDKDKVIIRRGGWTDDGFKLNNISVDTKGKKHAYIIFHSNTDTTMAEMDLDKKGIKSIRAEDERTGDMALEIKKEDLAKAVSSVKPDIFWVEAH